MEKEETNYPHFIIHFCRTLFIWIGVNIADADSAVGIKPLLRKCNLNLIY